jgi:hypothetical protein
MPEASPNGTETELALAVTRGLPAAKWARTTGVPSITAWRWAKDPVILPFAACRSALEPGWETVRAVRRNFFERPTPAPCADLKRRRIIGETD